MEQTPDATPQTDETAQQTTEQTTDDKESAQSEEATAADDNDAGEQTDDADSEEAEETENGGNISREAAKWRVKAREAKALADKLEQQLHDYRLDEIARGIGGHGWKTLYPELGERLEGMDLESFYTPEGDFTQEARKTMADMEHELGRGFVPTGDVHPDMSKVSHSPKMQFQQAVMSAGRSRQ